MHHTQFGYEHNFLTATSVITKTFCEEVLVFGKEDIMAKVQECFSQQNHLFLDCAFENNEFNTDIIVSSTKIEISKELEFQYFKHQGSLILK